MRGGFVLLLCVAGVVGQTTLLSVGDFFTAYHWSAAQAPSCLVPACDEEQNINFVLPVLCCSLLPTGPFLSYNASTAQLNFSVPAFLAAALAPPQCQGNVFALTQMAFSFLEAASYLRLNVFEGVAQKIPWCAQPACLSGGITQINFYVSKPCASSYCPYTPAGASKRSEEEPRSAVPRVCYAATVAENALHNDSATYTHDVGQLVQGDVESLRGLSLDVVHLEGPTLASLELACSAGRTFVSRALWVQSPGRLFVPFSEWLDEPSAVQQGLTAPCQLRVVRQTMPSLTPLGADRPSSAALSLGNVCLE